MSVFPFGESDSTKLWSEYNLTISVQTDSVNMESVVYHVKRIPKLGMVVTPWHNDCCIGGISPYIHAMVVSRGKLVCTCRYGCSHGWIELFRSQRAKFNLVTHMWSKDFKSSILNDLKLASWKFESTEMTIGFISWLNELSCQVGNDSLLSFM